MRERQSSAMVMVAVISWVAGCGGSAAGLGGDMGPGKDLGAPMSEKDLGMSEKDSAMSEDDMRPVHIDMRVEDGGIGDMSRALADAALGMDMALETADMRCECDPPHAVGRCDSGACRIDRCHEGWLDCNGDPTDGCEVDIDDDPEHCGACRTRCSDSHATPLCRDRLCVGDCDPGWEDCNGDKATDGCEVHTASDTNHCGACGTVCETGNATPICTDGDCGISMCPAGAADCDHELANGCEVDTQTDAMNCDGCGTRCALDNAVAACRAGQCAVARCQDGYEDCDGDPRNGCEAHVGGSDPQNCGGCGKTCQLANASSTCRDGACALTLCDSGYEDCDGKSDNGCEAQTSSDVLHCGGCRTTCSTNHIVRACGNGVCNGACEAGWSDCDGDKQANGCEVQTGGNDAKNCGGCGVVCPTVCQNGACALVVGLSLGGAHTCAQIQGGTVKCWGKNNAGQLGDGTITERRSPALVPGLTHVAQIALGDAHTCARLDDGTVKCWGSNIQGQLGDGTKINRSTPTLVPDLAHVAQLALGDEHTCALLEGGTVKCWGSNGAGRLGDGTDTDHSSPTLVAGLTHVAQIAAGASHTCALIDDGTVQCWGWNNFGQLGDKDTFDQSSPTLVYGLANATQVAAGGSHTCALLDGGTVKCWGWNLRSELGDGTTMDRNVPTPVLDVTHAVQVAAGGSHTCARLDGDTVSCWGDNGSGQLGVGTSNTYTSPALLPNLSHVARLALGGSHTCAQIQDGTMKCWGDNTNGQLGDGTATKRTSPAPVAW